MKRVIVCGGRNYTDRATVWQTLDRWHRMHGIEVLAQGGAQGADALAAAWADEHRVSCLTYRADWSRGRRAGPERNARMLAETDPTVVIAFPGGRGTADMVRQANASGVRVWRIAEAPAETAA